MSMPITERHQLFKTVADLHNQGKVKLSQSDRKSIESETLDLVRKSVLNRQAGVAPLGFDKLLADLAKVSGDPDRAFEMVRDFMEADGLGDSGLGDKDPMPGGIGDPIIDALGTPDLPPKGDLDLDLGGPGKLEESGDKEPSKFDKSDDKEPSKLDKSDDKEPSKFDKSDDKEPSKFDKSDDKDSGKSEKPDDTDAGAKRDALLLRAQAVEPKSIKDLQKKRSEEGIAPSVDEMGVQFEEGADMSTAQTPEDVMVTARALKIKIAVTEEGNLVAHHADHGPVFCATPSREVKDNRKALSKLAKQVYGMCLYQGFAVAASKCNATILRQAGVDDDIETDTQEEVSPETEGITQQGESDTRDDPRGDEKDSTLSGFETDTREKPDTVKPTRAQMLARHKAKYEAAKRLATDILDDADNVITPDEKPNKPTMDTGAGAENNQQEQPDAPAGDILEDADDDIRSASAKNLRELYQRRAVTQVLEEKEAFVRKFTKAFKIAATRMQLNHTEHPMKVAMVDCLVAEDIELSDGDVFVGMDERTAIEMTELITSEGHEHFIAQVLSDTADLLEKSDQYILDLESDVRNLAPIAVVTARESHMSQRAGSARREASSGNLKVENTGNNAPSSPRNTTDLRSALGGGTHLGRRLSELSTK